MIDLRPEMTYRERIEGPLTATTGAPLGERLCWQIADATLTGPRIHAVLAMPGTDWVRLGPDGIRRPDLRAQLRSEDGQTILLRYDAALIRSTPAFTRALAEGRATAFGDQEMFAVPQFEVGPGRHAWLTEHLFLARGRLAGPRQIEYEIFQVGSRADEPSPQPAVPARAEVAP
jgi:uncharacterized protein DUF3237